MPIYEYRCEACNHELEALQKMSDDVLKRCPECESESLIKKVSAAAFRLKGGGWYETDFKSGNKKNLASTDASKNDSNSGSSDKGSSDKGSSTKESEKTAKAKPAKATKSAD